MIKKQHVFAILLIGVIVAVYCFMASYYINNGELNADEGFYALAAKKAMAAHTAARGMERRAPNTDENFKILVRGI